MRPHLSPAFAVALALTSGLALASAACDRAPTADGLKEWTPADHEGEKKSGAVAPNQGPRGDAGAAPSLADITWRNQCSSCHGPGGKGDGPQGAMVKAADLTQESWQSKIKDEEIAAAIVNGKGRMPKFELPEDVVKGLVGRVRSFRGN